MLSPDVTYRVLGNHPLSGTFHGPDEVTTHMRKLVEWTKDTFETLKWEDWLVGQHYIGALVRIHAQGHGSSYKGRIIFLLGFDSTNKVSEITVLYEDASAADRFFGP